MEYYSNSIFLVIFLIYLLLPSTLQEPILKDGQTFDFIVVGGGTGGCVVAARLADSGKHSVLLIHEGGVPNDNLNIPALSRNIRTDFPNEMKFYSSVPQQNSNLENNGIIRYAIGKAIGGGSSINGGAWSRGNPLDFDNWVKILNDSSWSYENMLPYFQKSENYRGIHPTNQRGYNGPISIENPTYMKFGAWEFLDASRELGYPMGDVNGPQTPSATIVDYSHYRGRRVSAFSGYIGPLLQKNRFPFQEKQKRNNLVILLNTEAKRLVFNGNRAVGVSFLSLNSSQFGFAKVRKEIIMSAGAMDSPAILMRSGIGPKSVLDAAKIPIVQYLEGVGKNLQDHTGMVHSLILGNRSAAYIPSRDLNPETWKEYQISGSGPYSLYSGQAVQGLFLSSIQKQLGKPWPDLHLIPMNVETPLTTEEINTNEVAVSWVLLTTRNKSKGTVTINPNDIDKPPVINLNYYDYPDDMRKTIDMLKIADKMCENTFAMQRIGCRLPTTPLAACKHLKLRSDAYYQCTIRQRSYSGSHAGGTCKMGRKNDPEAVVDSALRVIGIQNLRIVDASVMPVTTNSNPQAPIYAIAERAASMILSQWDDNDLFKLNLNREEDFFKLFK